MGNLHNEGARLRNGWMTGLITHLILSISDDGHIFFSVLYSIPQTTRLDAMSLVDGTL